MDATGFDRLTRVLAVHPSRRGTLRALAGLGLGGLWIFADFSASSAKKKCGKCKRRKNGRCKPKPDGTSCGTCRVCDDGFCGDADNGTSCGTDKVCQEGACIPCPQARQCNGPVACCAAGQVCSLNAVGTPVCANTGLCEPVSQRICVNPSITCLGRADCECVMDVNGKTRCGTRSSATGCNQCTTNPDCHPITGNNKSFCVESGSNACCGPGQRFCMVPCPA